MEEDRVTIYSAIIKGHYAEIVRKSDIYTSELICTIATQGPILADVRVLANALCSVLEAERPPESAEN